MPTSLSDINSYKTICQLAASNEDVFSTFKQHPHYTQILEHVSESQGRDYLDLLPTDFNFEPGKLNDKLGNPVIYNYPKIGLMSPTSLRYLKVAHDIQCLFSATEHMKEWDVCEVGGGYGGQALILHELFGWKTFNFVDLPEAISLIHKYMSKVDLVYKCLFNWSDDYEYDLFISNYAFTEICKKEQERIIKDFILPSKRGYITANFVSRSGGIYSLSHDDLLAKLSNKNPKVLPEIPLTHQNNVLIIWGQD